MDCLLKELMVVCKRCKGDGYIPGELRDYIPKEFEAVICPACEGKKIYPTPEGNNLIRFIRGAIRLGLLEPYIRNPEEPIIIIKSGERILNQKENKEYSEK